MSMCRRLLASTLLPPVRVMPDDHNGVAGDANDQIGPGETRP
jgi:hypothetical protein